MSRSRSAHGTNRKGLSQWSCMPNIAVCKTQMPPFPNMWKVGLTYWPECQLGSSTHQGLSTYQVWSFLGKVLLSYPLHKVWETDMTFDLDLWPTDLTINRDHLLIKDYLPTKFEASKAKRSWVISCTRLRDTDILTDMCNTGGHKYQCFIINTSEDMSQVKVFVTDRHMHGQTIRQTNEF